MIMLQSAKCLRRCVSEDLHVYPYFASRAIRDLKRSIHSLLFRKKIEIWGFRPPHLITVYPFRHGIERVIVSRFAGKKEHSRKYPRSTKSYCTYPVALRRLVEV